MRIRFKSKEIYEWHSWFAWYPVKICDNIVLFENVKRKRGVYNFGISYLWIYKFNSDK